MKQISYVMVKPEFANDQRIIDEVKGRLGEKGIKILEEGFIKYNRDCAKKHYRHHVGKAFYPELEDYIVSDKAYGMKVEGENAIATIRELAGSTKDPKPGTIRFDVPEMFGYERRITQNVVHSSDNEEDALFELSIFEELLIENEKN